MPKVEFLQELRSLRTSLTGPWALCGDFNLIYQAADKNNGRLSRRMMGRFRRFLNDLELSELHLNGLLLTSSNERTHPTWSALTECSFPTSGRCCFRAPTCRHSPPDDLTTPRCCNNLTTAFTPKRRFHFRAFWLQFGGYLEAVEAAWIGSRLVVDPLRTIDHLLREIAKGLKRWRVKVVGSIRTQIQVAKEVIFG